MFNIKTKNGLRVRPSYEQLMDAIVEDDIIQPKKPINVFDANWLMSTPQMTQLRKDAFLDIQNLEMKMQQQQLLDMKAKEIAKETGKDIREAREEVKEPHSKTVYYDMSDGGRTERAMDDAYYEMELEDAERKRKEEEKNAEAVKKVKSYLKATAPNTMAHQMASSSSAMDEEPKEEKLIKPGRPKIGVVKPPLTKKTSKRKKKKEEEPVNPIPPPLPMIVNDEETQQKRKETEPSSPKPRKKTKKEIKKEIKEEKESEKKRIIKQQKKEKEQTTRVKREMKSEGTTGVPASIVVPQPKPKPKPKPKRKNDDVEIGTVAVDRSTPPEDMSAKEMRNQLHLREPDKIGDWQYKTRAQLMSIIKKRIKAGTW